MKGLKPCPFCGSSASVEECELTPFKKAVFGATFSCGCDNEDCIVYQSITTFARRSDAIKAWNTRHNPDQATITEQAKLIEQLREALEATDKAYCGVGDFEGTGENMATVIVSVRQAFKASDAAMGGK